MFSFIKKYAETLEGISVYPIIALMIFLAFFTALVFFALKANKNYLEELSNIPLDNPNQNDTKI